MFFAKSVIDMAALQDFFLICIAQLKPQHDNEISKPLYIRELLGVLWFFYRKVVFNESNIQMVNY